MYIQYIFVYIRIYFVYSRHSLFLVSVITHRELCPRHCDHSQCLSPLLFAFLRRLASLNEGVWLRSLCPVRVPNNRSHRNPSVPADIITRELRKITLYPLYIQYTSVYETFQMHKPSKVK